MKPIERLWTRVFTKFGMTLYMDRLIGKGVYLKKCLFGVTMYKNTIFGKGSFTVEIYLGIVVFVIYYWRPEYK
jgi:hypothetical protein